MLIVGALLALFVVFNFILPMVAMLVKLAVIVAVVALVLFIAVRVIGGSPSR